jgi:hypothetical protein
VSPGQGSCGSPLFVALIAHKECKSSLGQLLGVGLVRVGGPIRVGSSFRGLLEGKLTVPTAKLGDHQWLLEGSGGVLASEAKALSDADEERSKEVGHEDDS